MIKNKNYSLEDELPELLQDETLTFGDTILALAKNAKFFLLLPTLLSILSMLYVLFFASPVYESSSKIMSSNSADIQSEAFGLAAQFGINIPTNNDQVWVYSELINSRMIAKRMLKRNFQTINGQNKTFLQIINQSSAKKDKHIQRNEILAVEKVLSMISFSENKKSGVFTIKTKANDPALAYQINSALIEELDTHQKKYNKEKKNETRLFIESRIYDTMKELELSEESLKNFSDRNRRRQNSPLLQLETQRLEREVTVLTGVYTTLKQQLEKIKIEEVRDSDYVVVLDRPEVPIYRSSPSKKKWVLFSIFLGLTFSVILSLILEYFRRIPDGEMAKIKKAKYILFNLFKASEK